jgi:hypothetical protein
MRFGWQIRENNKQNIAKKLFLNCFDSFVLDEGQKTIYVQHFSVNNGVEIILKLSFELISFVILPMKGSVVVLNVVKSLGSWLGATVPKLFVGCLSVDDNGVLFQVDFKELICWDDVAIVFFLQLLCQFCQLVDFFDCKRKVLLLWERDNCGEFFEQRKSQSFEHLTLNRFEYD